MPRPRAHIVRFQQMNDQNLFLLPSTSSSLSESEIDATDRALETWQLLGNQFMAQLRPKQVLNIFQSSFIFLDRLRK